jgi:hypothetical protein
MAAESWNSVRRGDGCLLGNGMMTRAMIAHATIEESSEVMFPVWSVLRLYNWD